MVSRMAPCRPAFWEWRKYCPGLDVPSSKILYWTFHYFSKIYFLIQSKFEQWPDVSKTDYFNNLYEPVLLKKIKLRKSTFIIRVTSFYQAVSYLVENGFWKHHNNALRRWSNTQNTAKWDQTSSCWKFCFKYRCQIDTNESKLRWFPIRHCSIKNCRNFTIFGIFIFKNKSFNKGSTDQNRMISISEVR